MNIKVRNQIAEKLGVTLTYSEYQITGAVRYSVWKNRNFLGTITSDSSGGFLASELERKIKDLL